MWAQFVSALCWKYMITDEVCSPVPWKNVYLERLSDFHFTLYVDKLSKNNDFTGVCVSFAFNFSHLSDLCLWTIIYILPFFLSSLSNLETWYFWMRFVGSIAHLFCFVKRQWIFYENKTMLTGTKACTGFDYDWLNRLLDN